MSLRNKIAAAGTIIGMPLAVFGFYICYDRNNAIGNLSPKIRSEITRTFELKRELESPLTREQFLSPDFVAETRKLQTEYNELIGKPEVGSGMVDVYLRGLSLGAGLFGSTLVIGGELLYKRKKEETIGFLIE